MNPDEEDDDEDGYLTRDEALQFAKENAIRDLLISGTRITYICYEKTFDDYCRAEITGEADQWTITLTALANEQRLADERITDEKIRLVAASGRIIGAIRLYRLKYGVGLLEGKQGVESLLRKG